MGQATSRVGTRRQIMTEDDVAMGGSGDELEVERLEIERQRSEMGHTIDEIEGRLTPGAIADRARDSVVEMAGGAGSKVKASIVGHPVPALMTAAGIGYLLFKAFSGSSNGHSAIDGGLRNAAEGPAAGVDAVKSRVGDAVDSAAAKIDDARTGVTEGAHAGVAEAERVARGAAQKTSQTAEVVRRAIRENPTAAVVVAIGIGAAAGMAIPRTETEQRVLGTAGNELVDRASEKMQDVGDRAKTAATRAADAAKQELEA